MISYTVQHPEHYRDPCATKDLDQAGTIASNSYHVAVAGRARLSPAQS